MRRGVLWMLALGVVVALGSLRLGEPDLDPERARGHEVVLLSASWCGICAEARRFLKRGGVEFEEYDVERSERGRELYAKYGGGGVPIVLIDGLAFYGLDRAKWAAALEAPVRPQPLTPEPDSGRRVRAPGAEAADSTGGAAPPRRASG